MRLALYFMHHESLGHTERVRSLLSSLKNRFGGNIEILIIHSGKKQPIDLKPLGRVVNMPFSFGKEFFNKARLVQEIKALISKDRNAFKKRLRILKKSIIDFDPDIFITEHFPFGERVWDKELPLLLKFVKARGIKIVSSRGYPGCTKDSYRLVGKYYDRVLFHCTKKDAEFYLSSNAGRPVAKIFSRILSDFRGKINFTGYIINKAGLSPEMVRKKYAIPKGSKLVAVNRGGGVVYPKIISSSLMAAKRLSDKDICFLVSEGPATDEKMSSIYRKFAGRLDNVRLFGYIPNFISCLNASDLSINMAGYNTSVQLMRLGKQSICIPFNTLEQKYRSELLRDFNICCIMDYHSLDSEALAARITEMLNKPLAVSREIRKSDFRGAENSLDILKGMVT